MIQGIRSLSAFVIRDAQLAMSYPLAFALQFGGAITQILLLYFFSLVIGQNDQLDRYGGFLPFAAVGFATIAFLQASLSGFSSTLRREQMTGTIEAILMTPTSVPLFVVGSAGWIYISAALFSILYFAAAVLLFQIPLSGDPVAALLLLALMTLFFACLGIISASFVMVFKRGDPIAFMAGAASTILGGAFVPVEALPEWLQRISYLIPVTYALNGLRATLLEGETLADVAPELMILTAFNAVMLPISFYIFRRALRRAQRDGSLIKY